MYKTIKYVSQERFLHLKNDYLRIRKDVIEENLGLKIDFVPDLA